MTFIDIPVQSAISSKIQGKFLLIKYAHDENREGEFLDCVLDSLINYALTAQEQSGVGDIEGIRKLYKTAIARFVKNSKTGEFGEVILFHLLEVVEKAVQVVNKISLKTNGNVHLHGSDAVHFGLNGHLKILYLGESKTERAINSAIDNALSSLEELEKPEKKQFELNLASGNISDHLSPEMKKEIGDYLNPLNPDKSKFIETYAVLLCFNYEHLAELEKLYQGDELLKQVRS